MSRSFKPNIAIFLLGSQQHSPQPTHFYINPKLHQDVFGPSMGRNNLKTLISSGAYWEHNYATQNLLSYYNAYRDTMGKYCANEEQLGPLDASWYHPEHRVVIYLCYSLEHTYRQLTHGVILSSRPLEHPSIWKPSRRQPFRVHADSFFCILC